MSVVSEHYVATGAGIEFLEMKPSGKEYVYTQIFLICMSGPFLGPSLNIDNR